MCGGVSSSVGRGPQLNRLSGAGVSIEQPSRSVAVFLSHPIQHFVPWLQKLHERLEGRLIVHYASRHGLEARHDPEFGQTFAWEMDLLSGYQYRFWDDDPARGPGHGFWGVQYPGLSGVLRRERPSAVLLWGWLFAGYWHAAAVAEHLGVPYLLRGESNLLRPRSAATWWIKQQTIGRLCRGAAGCLAIGTHNARLYQEYGVPPSRIWTAPYFVDNDWFAAESARLKPARAALRAKYGLPLDAIVFLFIGKFIAKKHPDHLLRAWQALPAQNRERSALLMAGSGAMLNGLERQAAGDPRVVFSGLLNRPELPEAYAASDVLVLPSDAGETWGLVVNEAMASGLTVIVSDQVGCVPDLVREGRTGFTFPCGDESALADRLRQILDDPDCVASLGAAARDHVATASIDRAVATTVEALGIACSMRCLQPAMP
jgi:glycosyltransferase involved in cell wall biosynthesis